MHGCKRSMIKRLLKKDGRYITDLLRYTPETNKYCQSIMSNKKINKYFLRS